MRWELCEQLENSADPRAAREALADPENDGPPLPWEEVKTELDRLDRE